MALTSNLVGKIFFVIGLVLLGGAWFFYEDTRSFLQTAVSAPGEVIELVYTPRSSSSEDASGDVYNPVVSFRAENGGDYSFRHNIGSNPPSFSVGEKVTVLYDPLAPESSAKIDGFASLYLGTLILGFMGVIFTGVGALADRFIRRPQQKFVSPLPQQIPASEETVLERSRHSGGNTVERN